MAPLLRLETPTATTTTELEPESLQETAPVRFRTKAEMKMLGDAAAEAVRSWIVSSALGSDSSRPDSCEASPSGLSASPPEHCTSKDSKRSPPQSSDIGARTSVLVSPDTSVVGSNKGLTGSAYACVERRDLDTQVASSLNSSPSSPTITTNLPISSSMVAGLPKSGEQVQNTETAWEQSCLDFELQLEASENQGTLKSRSHRKSHDKNAKICDSVPRTSDEMAVSEKSLRRADSSRESLKVSRVKKISSASTCSPSTEITPTKNESKLSPSKRKIRVKLENEYEDSDSMVESEGGLCLNGPLQPKESPVTRSSRRTISSSQNLTPPKKSKTEKTEDHSPRCTRNRSNGMQEKVKSKTPEEEQRRKSEESSTTKEQPQEKGQHKLVKEKPSPHKSQNRSPDKGQILESEGVLNLRNSETRSVKIRLRTRVVEVEQAYSLRPKGDGSDFRPGWEEEVFQYKRSLRMPQVLINMSKGPINSEGECSKSPSVCSISDSGVKWPSRPSSEIDSSSYCPDVDSEDAASSISVSTSVISRRSNLKRSIVDKLVEKASKVSAITNKNGNPKMSENSIKKPLRPVRNIDRLKLKQSITSVKEQSPLRQDDKVHPKTAKKAGDSIQAVFGTEKVPALKSKAKANSENKIRSKSLPDRQKMESAPSRRISLRHRNIVATKPVVTKKGSNKSNASNNEGIVLRPRKVQPSACSRPGLRSAALIRRSKVVLNSKHLKVRNLNKQTQIKDPTEAGSQAESKENANDLEMSSNPQPTVVRKRIRLRRKFRSSGFDYIRKKKKIKKDDVKKVSVPKVIPVVERKPMTEEQIHATIRSWVINRSHGDTLLHRAARHGYAEVTQYGIEKLKISPRVADNAGYTPLHEAARRGFVELSKILLEHGADVSCSAQGGVRPLHEAAESNQVEMLRLLLEYGADPTLATYSNQTPLSIVEPDSEAHHLLALHLADVQGLPALPWKYLGPSKIFDILTYKGDYALQSPPSEESDSGSEIDVFSSEIAPPPLYSFHGESSSQFWVLLRDLMNVLNVTSEEEMFCLLSEASDGEPSPSQSVLTRTREISVDEFLQRTGTVTLCASLSNLPVTGSTRLVEYSYKVRALLNEEVTSLV